ncbi:hypothetical protein AYO21_03313 [Fonsecaea monophora]|uniref:Uncharacterized protein n=1 Tax=Fonsecaea monophora TaxID=254056 RepID=A0A177FDY1_9EURO|nr:hypothetical protein AYO21_03313 [Fonsecaea monophora]OAG42437.1 hypothetical protein AYO21_03313 [Fonsecaea monophora]
MSNKDVHTEYSKIILKAGGWVWLSWVGTIELQLSRSKGQCQSPINRVGLSQDLLADKAVHAWVSTTSAEPLQMQVTEPIVLFLSLYVALNFGILYNFFPAVPLAFIAITVSCLLATATNVSVDLALQRRTHTVPLAPLQSRSRQLEDILWPAIFGSVGIPIGLFWFDWTVRSDVHRASPVCALIPFAWGNPCVFASAISYLVNIYGPTYGASATAANAFARYGFAAAFPLSPCRVGQLLEPE